MKKAEYLSAVLKEIKGIKKHATKDQIAKLNHRLLEPDNANRCIYGQMTGDCFSKEASTLITKIKPSFLLPGDFSDTLSFSEMSFIDFKNELYKASPDDFELIGSQRDAWNTEFYTPLEAYIGFKDAKLKSIVDYLQGKRKELKL